MKRRDYRKMMNVKKRNRIYAKATVLGVLGLSFFGMTTQVHAESWKANSVDQIKEAVKEAKDGVYIIKTGDTLSGISEATGITIETLAKVNNIQNVDLIYAGDKLIIKTEDGKVALVDSNNTVKNEVPLTKEDKQGITEVQKKDTNNVYSNTGNSSKKDGSVNSNTSTSDSNTATTANPVKPTESTSTTDSGTSTKSTESTSTTDTSTATKPTESTSTTDTSTSTTDTSKPEQTTYKKDVDVTFVGKDGKEIGSLGYVAKDVEFNKKSDEGTVKVDLPKGYKLVDNEKDTKTVNGKDAKVSFTIEKIEDAVKTVDAKVTYVDADTFAVVKEDTVKVELGKDGTGKVVAVTPNGYELVGQTEATVTESLTAVTFDVKKAKEQTKVNVQVANNEVDKDGKLIKVLSTSNHEVLGGTNIEWSAEILDGYEVYGSDKQVLQNAKEGDVVTFNYVKRAPQNTDEYVYVNLDEDGNVLESTDGYTEVSTSRDNGVVVTNADGSTTTTYTTTTIWKKEYVPVHTEETVVVNIDEQGNPLQSTDGYTKIDEYKDKGVTTTAPNGDTHTKYTLTRVWKKDSVTPTDDYGARPTTDSELNLDFNTGDGVGNSGMTFDSQENANLYGGTHHPNGSGTWFVWEVQMKDGTIRYTVDFN
ncbi:LysM peptidoglycan-binding domain-containing protein [Vagococcus vulneris]|uniref:LysM domain-containing protein n=1 Tax=Vagococcus vulneris TaxID=1977869 RepID=A0A430A1F5_9ENTE|nr:LysM domain-containing protein [Vagococcus vulneris]RSU00241.1 hypothetical protein CBF37_02790 [Vagococcus vulneris]